MSISRRKFMAGAALAAATTSMAAKAQSPPQRQPNIVYLFSDEHRWQSMSHTELPPVRTPNMTRMRDEGFEFSNCISNYPVCSPYRAMLMTGRWPYEQGVIDNNIPLSPDQMTIGKAFQAAGYTTGYIGKWHLGGDRAEAFGFDTSLLWHVKGHHSGEYFPSNSGPVHREGYTIDTMTEQAVEFIVANKAKPFLLMVSYVPPHAPFDDAPDDLWALYPQGTLPWRPNASPSKETDAKGAFRFSEKDYSCYHANITGMDRALGRVLAALDELELTEDTIVIYTSDHGSMFGSHGVGSKRQPYEESIRVPFLMRCPRHIPARGSTDALFGTIDVFPTLCGMAGIGIPQTCRGLDFSPWLRNETGPNPESQFIMHIAKGGASGGKDHPAPLFRGVRTRTHTYAVLDDGPVWLFDNASDPYQQSNRADDADLEKVRARCHGMLSAWMQSAHDARVLV
ncbi:MAG: sulfatase [Candidatus Hydrogenedentota bacterium]